MRGEEIIIICVCFSFAVKMLNNAVIHSSSVWKEDKTIRPFCFVSHHFTLFLFSIADIFILLYYPGE